MYGKEKEFMISDNKDSIFKMTIPYSFTNGKHSYDEIVKVSGDGLEIELGECEVLTYKLVNRKYEVRLYGVDQKKLTETLSAEYDETGTLQNVWFDCRSGHTLMYINLEDTEKADRLIMKEAERVADDIIKKIIGLDITFSRLFIERFFDGDCYTYCANYATFEMLEKVREKYGSEDYTLDNPGNYNSDNQLYCEDSLLDIMFICSGSENACMYYRKTSEFMFEHIKANVIDKINKSDDFKFIDREFD